MKVQETANRLVELCRKGEFAQAYDELFADNAVGIEPDGANAPPRTEGLDSLRKKNREFGEMVEEMHGMSISDPIVADRYFSCTMEMDATFKGMGRSKSSEVCLYETNDDGKVIKEQFFYTPHSQS